MTKKQKNTDSNKYSRTFKELEDRSSKRDPFIVLSLRNFDSSQGQSFQNWEEDSLLSLAINKLQHICALTVNEAKTRNIIKSYPNFPPNSEFSHPKHIPNDIIWCSLHIQGKECVIGFFEDNIFHLIFLDKNHEFWITPKRNT